jgi:group I intron endonuclease
VHQAGVYAIENTADGKLYVGSVVRGFERRWRQHRSGLRAVRHHSRYLQRAWNKHGETTFRFAILEICPAELCVEREQWWIDLLRPAYNMSPTAGSPLGVKHTLATRTKVSAAMIGHRNSLGYKHGAEARAAMSSAQRGRVVTPETRARISAAKKGRQGNKPSAETCAKLSAALMGNKNALGNRGAAGNRSRTGLKHTLETRAKMSAAGKRAWAERREKSTCTTCN